MWTQSPIAVGHQCLLLLELYCNYMTLNLVYSCFCKKVRVNFVYLFHSNLYLLEVFICYICVLWLQHGKLDNDTYDDYVLSFGGIIVIKSQNCSSLMCLYCSNAEHTNNVALKASKKHKHNQYVKHFVRYFCCLWSFCLI